MDNMPICFNFYTLFSSEIKYICILLLDISSLLIFKLFVHFLSVTTNYKLFAISYANMSHMSYLICCVYI